MNKKRFQRARHVTISYRYSIIVFLFFINGCKTTDRSLSESKAVPQDGSTFSYIMQHGSDEEKQVAARVKKITDKYGSKDPSKFVVVNRVHHTIRKLTPEIMNGKETLAVEDEIFIGTIQSKELISIKMLGLNEKDKRPSFHRLGLAIQVFDRSGFTSGKNLRKTKGVVVKLKKFQSIANLETYLAKEFQKINSLITDKTLVQNVFGKAPQGFNLAKKKKFNVDELSEEEKEEFFRDVREKRKDSYFEDIRTESGKIKAADKVGLKQEWFDTRFYMSRGMILGAVLGCVTIVSLHVPFSAIDGAHGYLAIIASLLLVGLLAYFTWLAFESSHENREHLSDIDFISGKLVGGILKKY